MVQRNGRKFTSAKRLLFTQKAFNKDVETFLIMVMLYLKCEHE